MDNIKTCSNCAHHCPILLDPNSEFHIHDYCKVWRAVIPSFYLADSELDWDLAPEDQFIEDDIETNRAVCWCWKEKINNETNSN